MDDKSLIIAIQNGNTNAFRFLVEQNKNLVWHMVVRMVRRQEDAEDLSQEVFTRVFKDIKKFRGESKLSTWVASIAYHVCIDFIRKRGREKLDFTDDPRLFEQDQAGDDHPGRTLNLQELKILVNQIIDKMPLQYRAVITLFHLEEMTYKEIQEITRLPEGTVKSYLNRGRQYIREKIEGLVPDIHPVLFESDY